MVHYLSIHNSFIIILYIIAEVNKKHTANEYSMHKFMELCNIT